MIINNFEKTISIKIVYFGPALSGKTTSLKFLFEHFNKTPVLSIENTLKRTLFFDYGTISFQNNHWKLKIHIYSTTGQDFYKITRPIVLNSLDGILFIADSYKKAYQRNIQSWNELHYYFQDIIKKLPIVFCFNKQDLPNKFKSMDLLNEIGLNNYENIAIDHTIAIIGEGIIRSFEKTIKLIFQDLVNSKLLLNNQTYFS
ncbi:MAG: ATP/GTP-binding protein [Promethearchaeota archaeon]